MLRVIKNEVISVGENSITQKFVFEFDNASYLPINTYQMGMTTYIIADNSTAINISDNSTYTYKNNKWNITHDTIPTINNTITENGKHSIVNNEYLGYNDVNVNVPSDTPNLIEKTITENGIYNASDDSADGYSSVDVEVENINTTEYSVYLPTDYILPSGNYCIFSISPADGVVNNQMMKIAHDPSGYSSFTPIFLISAPLKKIDYPAVGMNSAIVFFTPDSDYDGFYSYYYNPDKKFNESGDTVVARDGYIYMAVVNFTGGSVTFTRTSSVAHEASVLND